MDFFIDPLISWLRSALNSMLSWFWDSLGFMLEWFKGYFDAALSWLWSALYLLFGWVIDAVYLIFADWLGGWFQWIADSLGAFFTLILSGFIAVYEFCVFIWDVCMFLKDCWNWCKEWFIAIYDFCYDFYAWLIGKNDEFGRWLWETIQKALTWLGDTLFLWWKEGQQFVIDAGKWLYNWVLEHLDKAIGFFVDLIGDLFDFLDIHIQLPAGAFNAVHEFIRWGMLWDEFLPVHETFQLLGLFLCFVVVMSAVRFVRSLIPFFH